MISFFQLQAATIEPDDPIRFIQLLSSNEFDEKEDILDLTLRQAIGAVGKKDEDIFSSSKLSKVTQLTGFSDPVYAEAYVNVNQYDIVLDVLIGMSLQFKRNIKNKTKEQCAMVLDNNSLPLEIR
jgi:coatomer subunit beta